MGDDPLTLWKGHPHPQSRGHRQVPVGLHGIPSSFPSQGWHSQKYGAFLCSQQASVKLFLEAYAIFACVACNLLAHVTGLSFASARK